MQTDARSNMSESKQGGISVPVFVATVVVAVFLIVGAYYWGLINSDGNAEHLQKNDMAGNGSEDEWVSRDESLQVFEYPYGWHVMNHFDGGNFTTRISPFPIRIVPSGPRLDLIEFYQISGEDGLDSLLSRFDSEVGLRSKYESVLISEDTWKRVYEYRGRATGGDYEQHDAVGYYTIWQAGPTSNTQSSCDISQWIIYSRFVRADLEDRVEVLRRIMLSIDMDDDTKEKRAEVCNPLFSV